jgi:hypothetical protein
MLTQLDGDGDLGQLFENRSDLSIKSDLVKSVGLGVFNVPRILDSRQYTSGN